METPHVGFSKRFQEDDIGLRVDQNLRRANVINYMTLTKNGRAEPDQDSDCMSYAEYTEQSQSDYSDSY